MLWLIPLVSGLLLALSGMAFGQVSPFSDSTPTGHTQILPAIGTDYTGIVIGGIGNPASSCPGAPVDLRDDGVIVQQISVITPPSGTTLKLTRLTLTNLGSAPADDLGAINGFGPDNLLIYDPDSKKCIATAQAISTPSGAPFSAVMSFSPAFDLSGVKTLAIALQAKSANNWSANQLGDTIHLRAHINYQSIQGGLISNFSTTIESLATFTLGLGALSQLSLLPSELISVNTNPSVTQQFRFAVDAANQGRSDPNYGLALVDVCVLNIGSASASRAINSATLTSSATIQPTSVSGTGTNLARETVCFGAGLAATGGFNGSGGLGVSLQTPPLTINSIISAKATTNFTLEIQLKPSAGLGQTLRLQTAFILAPAVRSGSVQTQSKIPGGVSPRVLMSQTLTIESGQPHLGLQDATVIIKSPGQDFPPTTKIVLEASNFKAPGVQSFSASLSYTPVMVQIAGSLCNGIGGVTVQTSSLLPYQTQVSACQVDNGRGRASFTVSLKSGSPPTAGPAPLVTIALQAGVQANTSASALITLTVTDTNGNPISVAATPGLVHFSPGGDLNADRQVGIDDAITLANAIINALAAGCGSDAFAGLLTVPQLEAADIAFPFTVPKANPPIFASSDFTCATITSADVAAIARRALSASGASALRALAQLQPELNPPSALQVRALTLRGVAQGGSSVALIAHGQSITGLELRLYDLAGRLVLGAQASGQRLSFRLSDKLGRPLARGVYLYVVKVRGFNGKIWRSQVRKLLLR